MTRDAGVTQVRRFNRVITQRVGALDEHYLARSRPLGASRVLWEIGDDGSEVRALRARLGMDSGQLSRLLRSLEADGLVEVTPSPVDARVRVVRLTRAGAAERALVDARSDALARSILEPLDRDERDELLAAMRTVQRLITASAVDIRVVDPAGADARRCLRAYFAELRRRSDALMDRRRGSSAEPHELRPPAGAFLIAYRGQEPVGCGAVKHRPGGPSDIKRMWVAEPARGLGIGRRLLTELERLAWDSGAPSARLETNRELAEALAMYRSAGYVEVSPFNDEPYAHHWLSKPLRPLGVTPRPRPAPPSAG